MLDEKQIVQAPQSLVKYQPSVEIYESMKQYHQSKSKENVDPTIPPRQQQIIDSILPPRDWTDHFNKLHIQYVSHQPASREDVKQLQKTLDETLNDRQARQNGICGIRQELFSQTYDEIIRQVAIDCPERGLLLMRVRDQRKMTLAAYQTVFQSSVAYGVKKLIETQQDKDDFEEQYEALLEKQKKLQEKKFKLLCQKDIRQKQIKQNRVLEQQRRQQQIKFLNLQQQNITKFLQSVKMQMK